jgi:CheY-like chemotaxis protein
VEHDPFRVKSFPREVPWVERRIAPCCGGRICVGLGALEEMRREPLPCVVLLDLHMPVMDGFGFRAEQVKHPDLMAIPVVLYSGHNDVRAAAKQMGIEAFFQKPFDITAVLTLVGRYTTCQPET